MTLLKNFCTRHWMGPRKSAFNWAPHLLRPALIASPKFSAYLVILWFQKQRPKQNTVARPKSNIMAPPKFSDGYAIGWQFVKFDQNAIGFPITKKLLLIYSLHWYKPMAAQHDKFISSVAKSRSEILWRKVVLLKNSGGHSWLFQKYFNFVPDVGRLHHTCNRLRLLVTCSMTMIDKQNHKCNRFRLHWK